MQNVRRASDNLPIWAKEKRAPTRAELAEKHFADGGGMGSSGPGNSLPDDAPTGETELVELFPGTWAHKPKEETPVTPVKIRKVSI